MDLLNWKSEVIILVIMEPRDSDCSGVLER